MRSGTLFTQDYLKHGVTQAAAFQALGPDLPRLIVQARAILAKVADPATLIEAQTEQRIVQPLLDLLGWAGAFSVQERMEQQGRRNVPDYLLFATPDAFAAADGRDVRSRYGLATAVADAKAWDLDLDRRGHGAGQDETPAGQILRYMARAHTISDRGVRFGILTNGRLWRLYFQDAKSLLQDYFEVDLAWALGLSGSQGPLGDADLAPEETFHRFLLFFGRAAFEADAAGRTLHDVALNEGRLWETRVRDDLASVVFEVVYPGLIRALIEGDPAPPPTLDRNYLQQVREAALTALYRLLFCLYAEDRDLLPRRDRGFDDYTLTRLRDHVAGRMDRADLFSARLGNLWAQARNLFSLIDRGDESLGVPPYNGGLFSTTRAPLLERATLSDRAFAPLLDRLSRRKEGTELKRINYRDLSVRELGSIYERLLEHEPVADAAAPAGVAVRLNPFARKGSGSYYTPDVLVQLIVQRTLGPLVAERLAGFEQALATLAADRASPETVAAELNDKDPAAAILKLKVCDPAMGSGHFLVALVDWLAEQAFTAIDGARQKALLAGHAWTSPVQIELEALRESIAAQADLHHWRVDPRQLTDANLVKRLVLKRCVYGVDKNPMAVELAKVALWLHTFTAGAPLSFLDHHLRCGDSLFGEWVDEVVREADVQPSGRKKQTSPISGSGLFLGREISRAVGAEQSMRAIEALSDGVLSEVEQSAAAFGEVTDQTRRLAAFLDFRQALRWLKPGPEDLAALRAFLDEQFGRPLDVLVGDAPMQPPPELARDNGQIDLIEAETAPEQMSLLPGQGGARDYVRAKRLVDAARTLAAEQRFLHWQVAFPGVWRGWRDARTGGFDAVIGNPPWDRMKMQEVEWFAERHGAIARQVRAADRKAAIAALRTRPLSRPASLADSSPVNGGAGQPPSPPPFTGEVDRPQAETEGARLADAYDLARDRAETAMEVARSSGHFPLLSRGDINLYSLFVERAQALIAPRGAAGLLTPSGIASDLTAAPFFKSLSTAGRVLTLFDFENGRMKGGPAFPDVHRSFKFCAFVAGGPQRTTAAAECAFFLQDPPATDDPRLFRMTAEDFARVNPNTGTAPIFRSARDAELTRAIYARLPVLVDRSPGAEVKAWPVKYLRMFDMTNDSRLFWTEARLEKEGAYREMGGHWKLGEREWLPLYEGKMVQAFDHRAASVVVNAANLHRPAQPEPTTEAERANSDFIARPQFWVEAADIDALDGFRDVSWTVGFKDVTAPTNERTMIAAALPRAAYGNTTPVIWMDGDKREQALWLGTLNSFAFDYVGRSKVQGQHLNWFIVEQLPVIPPAAYARAFGPLTAGEIVRDHVLRLSYTAHDLAAFARDMGWVYAEGEPRPQDKAVGDVKPPFRWDEPERRHLRARLDALYFILYGVTERADVDHVLSTFPIVERKDRAEHHCYLTRELVHAYMARLQAGDPTGTAPDADLIAAARRRERSSLAA